MLLAKAASLQALALAFAGGGASAAPAQPHPPLSVIRGALLTTAGETFRHQGEFKAAVEWHEARLDDARPAPYLACASPDSSDRSGGGATLSHVLGAGAIGGRVVASSAEHGVCVVATATPGQAESVFQGQQAFSSWAPFPSALKLAPGLLDHPHGGRDGGGDGRLRTTHGERLRRPKDRKGGSGGSGNGGAGVDGSRDVGGSSGGAGGSGRRSGIGDNIGGGPSGVTGLTVELAPGVLAATNRRGSGGGGWYASSGELTDEWREELMSESLDVHGKSFWSSGWSAKFLDESAAEGAGDSSGGGPGEVLAREWTRAADVLRGLGGTEGGPTIGEVCSWDGLVVVHTDDDLLTMKGMDHLLPEGRGAGGNEGPEADELQVACFMALLSFLASRPEVLRVSPARAIKLLNAAAYHNVQSANLTESPMTDAGLDGTGEVIQIVDTGLDVNSCFFVDEDGGEGVAHGHYFEEIGVEASALSSWFTSWDFNLQIARVFTGGDFNFDLSRRKIVQYINLIRQDSETNSTANNSTNYGESWATSAGDQYPWISAAEFAEDYAGGHGTHTAGSAAGAVVSSPSYSQTGDFTEVCEEGRELSCVGGCIDVDDTFGEDDLITTWDYQYFWAGYEAIDLDRLCPRLDCDDRPEEYCLGDDEAETLQQHGGVARGAQLAIFDILDDYTGIGIEMAGNGMWEPAMEAGSKLSSNSWGISAYCEYLFYDVLYDDFMYRNQDQLLLFAAGNDGEDWGSCTMGSPALAKNVLAVGASTSGPGRLSFTDEDGDPTDGDSRVQDIDTMAYFSSFGPTLDGRIKPEVVAPGDMIYSAAGGGDGNYTCRLWQYAGTSMSTPVVAGAAALVRQYFKNETFYAHDVEERGFCDSFGCEPFAPSAATVKAMLINSANLMGGSEEPDGLRGFGRVHLEAGMPLAGEGDNALFVADSAVTSTTELTLTEYSFAVDAAAGLDLRATLSWIDPPATTFSSIQLVHDLDLSVYSPTGLRYSMWRDGTVDSLNNNERVIVPASNILEQTSSDATATTAEDGDGDGTWTVRVWSKRLAGNETQSYSLVVTGAIGPPTLSGGSTTTTANVGAVAATEEEEEDEDEEDASAAAARGGFSSHAVLLLASSATTLVVALLLESW